MFSFEIATKILKDTAAKTENRICTKLFAALGLNIHSEEVAALINENNIELYEADFSKVNLHKTLPRDMENTIITLIKTREMSDPELSWALEMLMKHYGQYYMSALKTVIPQSERENLCMDTMDVLYHIISKFYSLESGRSCLMGYINRTMIIDKYREYIKPEAESRRKIKTTAAIRKYIEANGTDFTDEDYQKISEIIGIKDIDIVKEHVKETLNPFKMISFSAPAKGDDEEITIGDVLASVGTDDPEDAADVFTINDMILNALDQLSDSERFVISMLRGFEDGIERTKTEVAKILCDYAIERGIVKYPDIKIMIKRVSKLEKSALGKITTALEQQGLSIDRTTRGTIVNF